MLSPHAWLKLVNKGGLVSWCSDYCVLTSLCLDANMSKHNSEEKFASGCLIWKSKFS